MSCNYKEIRKIVVNNQEYKFRFISSGDVQIFKDKKQIYKGGIQRTIPSFVKALICRIETNTLKNTNK